MRFPDAFLDEIRARLPVSAVVGRKVRLKKQGREFAGLSPFNAEKTPSFFVNDGKRSSDFGKPRGLSLTRAYRGIKKKLAGRPAFGFDPEATSAGVVVDVNSS